MRVFQIKKVPNDLHQASHARVCHTCHLLDPLFESVISQESSESLFKHSGSPHSHMLVTDPPDRHKTSWVGHHARLQCSSPSGSDTSGVIHRSAATSYWLIHLVRQFSKSFLVSWHEIFLQITEPGSRLSFFAYYLLILQLSRSVVRSRTAQ